MNGPRQRAKQIYEELRGRICLLDYEPGAIIKERELANEFGVSRTPLRRVLQKLESDGLVLSRQGHGTVVTEIDLQAQKDIYLVRMKLAEIIGASQPEDPTPETLQSLDELAERCRTAMENPNPREFGEINIGLHKQIQSVIRNQPLRETSDRLFYQTSRMWFRLLPRMDLREELRLLHEEILAVRLFFELGDVEAVGFTHRNYLSIVAKRLDQFS